MIPENYKTFLNIGEKQLPAFITENENYATFVAFLEAYYQWMSENGNVEERSKNLLNYKDIDNTLDEFEEYFFNEFLKYFPEQTLVNKRELVKLSKKFYERKSTSSSYKFLFRSLYNKDVELYNTRDSILIASDGKWVQGIYIRLDTIDIRFLRTKNLKIFGENTKSVANIERVYPIENKIEFQISDVKRKFISGEFIRIVDNNLNDVYFDDLGNIVTDGGTILKAKLVGNITSVDIDPNKRGKYYKVGDPITFIGGLNPEKENVFAIEASAEVEAVAEGSILDISITNPGHGFTTTPNSVVTFTGGGGIGANAIVSAVNTADPAIVVFWGVDQIEPYANVYINAFSYGISTNPSANANTKLTDAFANISFLTYPISEINIVSGGKNYVSTPTIDVESRYTVNFDGGTEQLNVKELGILYPIKIDHKGQGHAIGEEIIISGGTGIGAFANIANVDINGSITEINYYQKNDFLFPFGGMGYTSNDLPTVATQNTKIYYRTTSNSTKAGNNILTLASTSNVKVGMYVSGNGISNVTTLGIFNSNTTVNQVDTGNNIVFLSANLTSNNVIGDSYKFDGSAILSVNGILGDGEAISSTISNLGEIQSIKLTYQGEDYISSPNTSLKVVDIIVERTGITTETPLKNSFIYQSATEDANDYQFYGYFDKLIPLNGNYIIRIYNYAGTLNVSGSAKPLYIDKTESNDKAFGFEIQNINDTKYTNGVCYYGDGTAKANVNYLSGTTFGKGKYLNSDGFLSADKVLESEIYNDFTYFITLEQEFKKYKELIYNVLHPAGTQVIGRNVIPSNNSLEISTANTTSQKIELKYVTYANVNGSFTLTASNTANSLTEVNSYDNLPKPTNLLQIYDLRKDITEISLSDVISQNDYVYLTSIDKEVFVSQVKEIDDANDIIYFYDYKITNYANVARGYTNSNTIIIKELTGTYDLINNGYYANSNNYLFDIVKANDYVFLANNYVTQVTKIDYNVNSWILYANNEFNISGNSNNLTNISIIRNFSANSIVINA